MTKPIGKGVPPEALSKVSDEMGQYKKAQDAFKRQDPYEAFAKLKALCDQDFSFTKLHPEANYLLALYAFSCSDLTHAKKYLKLAEATVSQDPDGAFAQEFGSQIASLRKKADDPSLSTLLANQFIDAFGDGAMAHKILAQLGKGRSKFRVPVSQTVLHYDMDEIANTKPNAQRFYDPGTFGTGGTLKAFQAAGLRVFTAPDKETTIHDTAKALSTSRSPMDLSRATVTLEHAGKSASAYDVAFGGTLNLANFQTRLYEKAYGGFNLAAYFSAEERADLFDAASDFVYSGGNVTLGNEALQNLITVSLDSDFSVGEQSVASAGFNLRKGDSRAGFTAGGFAGVQSSGTAGVLVDGIGGRVFGQLWEGIGAKATAQACYKNGQLSFDVGAGAALGEGAYVELGVMLDLNQIFREIEGIAQSADKLGDAWQKKAGTLGYVAGAATGAVEATGKLAEKTALAAVKGVERLEEKTLFGRLIDKLTKRSDKH